MFRSFMLVLVVGGSCVFAEESETYPTTYDYLNVSEILANDRLRDQYFACVMDREPCQDATSRFYKEFFPEVIATQCRKCNDRQKEQFGQIAEWYTENQLDNWNALIAKGIEDLKKAKNAKGD